jgi:hypothetical protein
MARIELGGAARPAQARDHWNVTGGLWVQMGSMRESRFSIAWACPTVGARLTSHYSRYWLSL